MPFAKQYLLAVSHVLYALLLIRDHVSFRNHTETSVKVMLLVLRNLVRENGFDFITEFTHYCILSHRDS